METYYRKRSKKADEPINPITHKPFFGRHDSVPSPPSPDHCILLSKKEQAARDGVETQIQNHVDVGFLYEIDHIHLPPGTPVHLSSIRVAMVCENTELNIAVRYPSKESLRAFFSYSTRETHPALDEKFVMGTVLAAKVLHRKVPAEEYSDQKHLENFWVVNSSSVNSTKNDSSFIQNLGTCLSDLECKFMVRWGTRRQVKYLGRHKESGGNSNHTRNSSSSFVNGVGDDEIEIAVEEQEEEEVNEADDDEINDVNCDNKETVKEELEEEMQENEEENGDDLEDDEEEECIDKTGNKLKRKGYRFRNRNAQKAKKGKVEIKKKNQKQKKNLSKKSKCKNRFREALILRNPKDRWSSERYELAETNLLEVMKAKEATSDKPILRPQLRAEARKRIGDTGLLDHLLKHMAGKLAPGGKERFRRRHNADGAMEYWLESADLVNIRKDAGVTDPYWVPPLGWKPGDSPTQDPICARDIKLLKDDISTLKRDMELMATKKQLEEEVGKLRRERDELLTKKKEEENQAIAVSSCPCVISQTLNQFTNSLVTSKLDLDSAPAISVLEKLKEQLIVISDFVKEMEVSAKAEKRLGAAAAAGEKAAHIQRLKSGFRICKPQGTFLWPNMVKSNNSSPQVVVQVEVPTPPSVSSSSASAPLQILPYHRYPTSPVKPLAERRAVAVTVSTASNSPSYEDGANLTLMPSLLQANYGTRNVKMG